jgi:anti-sigma regulatory factor (Ser/Thr protein kinase)
VVKVRSRGEVVRSYILENVEKHPKDIAKAASEKFSISRQAVNKHLKNLVVEKCLVEEGNTRSRTYKLCPIAQWSQDYPLTPSTEEHIVWREDVRPFLGQLPENVIDIWHYCFTEMFNNAIDHSGAPYVTVSLSKTAVSTEIWIIDNGVGIFKKIQEALGLLDERHALLELAKGKLTTDPSRHTGEGIFFSSRMVDQFRILSSGTYFSHEFGDDEDWVLENEKALTGTSVVMRLNNHTARTMKKVFSDFSSEDIGFSKTVVPVRLAQYGDDKLVSRSQAKRLLDRVDRFKTVLFDFREVATIGQSFADEIFRVFRNNHPGIELIPTHANTDVQEVINRASHSDFRMRGIPSPPTSASGQDESADPKD